MNNDFLFTKITSLEMKRLLDTIVEHFKGAVVVRSFQDTGTRSMSFWIGLSETKEDNEIYGCHAYRETRFRWTFRRSGAGQSLSDWICSYLLNELSLALKAKIGCEAFNEKWLGKPNKFDVFQDYLDAAYDDMEEIKKSHIQHFMSDPKIPKVLKGMIKRK